MAPTIDEQSSIDSIFAKNYPQTTERLRKDRLHIYYHTPTYSKTVTGSEQKIIITGLVNNNTFTAVIEYSKGSAYEESGTRKLLHIPGQYMGMEREEYIILSAEERDGQITREDNYPEIPFP
ncbi:MAG: hypothetical protein WC916_04655 [Candidatus Woesearchaeota archaeon]